MKKKAHIICIFIEKILNPDHQESWWTTSLFLNENKNFEQRFQRIIENRFYAEINIIFDKFYHDEKSSNLNKIHQEYNQNNEISKNYANFCAKREIKEDTKKDLFLNQK